MTSIDLGGHLRQMRIVDFVQAELQMLGMFTVFYVVSEGWVLTFLCPYRRPCIESVSAARAMFVGGARLHRFLISGFRTAGRCMKGTSVGRRLPRCTAQGGPLVS